MNPQVKQQWIDALRSETYSQIKGPYRTCQGYCAMGVLLDLYDKQSLEECWDYSDDFGYGFKRLSKVGIWAELDTFKDIVEANEDHGQSFAEIADYIEQNY